VTCDGNHAAGCPDRTRLTAIREWATTTLMRKQWPLGDGTAVMLEVRRELLSLLGGEVTIPPSDLEVLLAIAAWSAREHADALPAALVHPAHDLLARYDVHVEVTPDER
jgi:hypothetical protein